MRVSNVTNHKTIERMAQQVWNRVLVNRLVVATPPQIAIPWRPSPWFSVYVCVCVFLPTFDFRSPRSEPIPSSQPEKELPGVVDCFPRRGHIRSGRWRRRREEAWWPKRGGLRWNVCWRTAPLVLSPNRDHFDRAAKWRSWRSRRRRRRAHLLLRLLIYVFDRFILFHFIFFYH